MNFDRAPNELTDGTGFQGYVGATYEHLCEVFGPPGPAGDKTQAEWCLRFEGGTIATVYDYQSRLPVERIRSWHVGGFNKAALANVQAVLGIKP